MTIRRFVKLLIARGADVNKKDRNNRNTPLHLAVMNRHLEIVKALTSAGANPNEKNNDGKTSLDMAGGEIKIVLQNAKKTLSLDFEESKWKK
jgi:ankyrin repeat protein